MPPSPGRFCSTKSFVNAPDDTAPARARLARLTGGARPMLAQGGLVLFQRLELLRFEQHLLGRAFPIPWKRLEHRKAAPASVQGEQDDSRHHPDRTDDTGVMMSEQDHDQEEEHAQ